MFAAVSCCIACASTNSVAVGVRCDSATAWCSQMCVDVGDNYECRCLVGYRLTDDGQSCVVADGKSSPYVAT